MLIQTALLQDHSCVNPPNRTETRRRREMGGWRRRRKEKEGGGVGGLEWGPGGGAGLLK